MYFHCPLYRPGFDGKDNLSQARTDMIVGCIEDLTAPTDEIFFAKEEEVKVREKYLFNELHFYYTC